MPLSSKHRSHLKSLAHPLSVLIRVGKNGVNPSLLSEISKTLVAHELIKVRIEQDDPDARRLIAEGIARELTAELVHVVGKVAILFRPDPDEPGIALP